jgi:glycosyltransferase involved in cell wall biosynthesis
LVTQDVGILVRPDDNDALADAMIRLALDSELRCKMGHAARRKYEQLFTPEVVLPVLTDFYERVVRSHANGQAPNTGNGRQPPSSHPWLE